MTQTGSRHRNLAINSLIAIVLSVVLNFSYLVFIMVGNHSEPTPKEPSRTQMEYSSTIGQQEGQREEVQYTPAIDSLKREVIIREESITARGRGRQFTHPLSTPVGRWFILLDIFFYILLSLLMLTIMTSRWHNRKINPYGIRLLMCAVLLVLFYFISPHLSWKGEIILTANTHHLLYPMTILKMTVAFAVCALYGKIYELVYAKQVVEMENEKLKNENLSWQYNTLVNQVNPHFLFNSLNSLSMLVREQKNSDAVTYIGQMSDTYRYIIEEGKAEKTTVESELRFLDAYRYLLEIRYAGKLHIEVNVGREYYSHELPPLSIQPLIENAVKHNTITSSKPLSITIKAEDDYIVVSNPISPKIEPEESTGIGLDNLSSRCRLIVGRPAEIIRSEKEFIVKLPINRPSK